MNMYGKLPQEQAMQTLVHDINQRTSGLRRAAQQLRNTDSINNLQVAQLIESSEKLILRTIDEYYKKFEADFPA